AALQRLRPRRHLRPERAPPGRRRAASRRHGPRRRRDAGDLRADLPDLDRRSHATRRLLSRLQRLAPRLLQGGARPAYRPADAAGDARGRARRARAGEGEGRRAPGESHDRQRQPQARRPGLGAALAGARGERHHPLLAHHGVRRQAGRSRRRQGGERLREHQVLPGELPRALRRPLRLGHPRAPPEIAHGDGRGRHGMASLARSGARLSPLATLGGEGVLGRQGRQRPRNEAERALQAADLRDLPGRPRGDLAHSVLWRWPPAVGVGLSAPRQRLAPLARSDRAADAAPVAGDAPQADSRQCGLALRAGRSISRGSVDYGHRVWSSWRNHSPTRRGRGDRSEEIAPMTMTDVYPGKDLGTLELTVTDEMVQHYIKGLDEPNPWYTAASPFGGPVAPVIIYQQADSEFKGWYLDNLFGNLWRRQEWEIYAPTRVGQVLRCSARVADRYRRRDRDVVAQEMWVRDEAGHLIARCVHHQSFLAEQTSGEVTLRDPASKDGARQGGEPSGEPLSVELRKTFTDAMCDEFFYRSRNYHSDKAASKELGLGDTVIGGRMTLSCVTELLTRHFGRGFYLGGRLDVKFTNVLWPNEPFTTRGIITSRRVEGGRTRAEVTVFCEKADGTKVIVASASALEG